MATELQDDGLEGVSFLDTLISQETRRRTREQTQPLIDMCCSPSCVRSTIFTVGIASLLLTTLLVAISITTSHKTDYPPPNPLVAPQWMLDQVNARMLRTHMQYLASDLLEGRAPGERGEDLAVNYIATHFRMAGLRPLPGLVYTPDGPRYNTTGYDRDFSDYLRNVPMRALVAQGADVPLLLKTATSTLTLTYASEYTADSDFDETNVDVYQAPMVFVGFGIVAPRYHWDDYKNVNVTGKIVVCLVNEPTNDSAIFLGDTLTYYGRWTYKYEQARAQGALGVLLIHTPKTAGYGWNVVQSTWGAGELLALLSPPVTFPLAFKGWITESRAEQLASLHGSSLSQWIAQANKPNFTPFTLESTFSNNMTYDVRYRTGKNVIGFLGPVPYDYTSSVAILAHHDHLGIRPSSNSNDSIYNGAVDNAIGVSALLSSAYAFGALYKEPFVVVPNLAPPELEKTIIFISTTAEEAGLLGASYLSQHSPCPSFACGMVSAFNFDILNVWGKTQDSVVIGSGLSSELDEAVNAAIMQEGMTVASDPSSGSGHLFRGDQLPLLLQGIPAVSLATGSHFVGKPDSYYANVTNDYITNRYHQPSDEYSDSLNMDGVEQQVRIVLRAAFSIATTDVEPTLDENNGMLPDND